MPRVYCIFTAISISLSLKWRQYGHRYAIRAGRNLPDKEFRYLRTVIVTAAIHRGLNSILCPYGLTSPFDLSALGRYHTLYVVLDDFAECCVFVKQSQPPGYCNPFQLQSRGPSPTKGTPSPEVTVLFCLVPSPKFSQAP